MAWKRNAPTTAVRSFFYVVFYVTSLPRHGLDQPSDVLVFSLVIRDLFAHLTGSEGAARRFICQGVGKCE